MELIVERPAALDVHKAQVTACVRVPDEHPTVKNTWPSSPPRYADCSACAIGWPRTMSSRW